MTATRNQKYPGSVWTYEHPYDVMLAIEDRIAFHPDKVDSITVIEERT